MYCIHTAVLTRPLLEKLRCILSDWSDFHMIDSLSMAVHAVAAAPERISTKLRTKHRVPWKILAVKKKKT